MSEADLLELLARLARAYRGVWVWTAKVEPQYSMQHRAYQDAMAALPEELRREVEKPYPWQEEAAGDE